MTTWKECPDCQQIKNSEEFGRNQKRPDGLAFYCKSCLRNRSTDGYRKRRRASGYSLRHDRGPTPTGHRFCSGCQDFVSLDDWFTNKASKSGLSSYCKTCMRAKGAESYLRRKYGLSGEQLQQLRVDQDQRCAICRKGPPEHIDHDHETGLVRGLLCFNCNAGLGQFKDRPDVLAAANLYLQEPGGKPASDSVPSDRTQIIYIYPQRPPYLEVELTRHPIKWSLAGLRGHKSPG